MKILACKAKVFNKNIRRVIAKVITIHCLSWFNISWYGNHTTTPLFSIFMAFLRAWRYYTALEHRLNIHTDFKDFKANVLQSFWYVSFPYFVIISCNQGLWYSGYINFVTYFSIFVNYNIAPVRADQCVWTCRKPD